MKRAFIKCLAVLLSVAAGADRVYADKTPQESEALYKIDAPGSFSVYEKPDLTSSVIASYEPQNVTVYETSGAGWALIDTHMGKYWAYFGPDMYLNRYRALYKEKGGKERDSEIGPQIIKPLERDGSWVKIDTWLGERWINLSEDYSERIVNPYKPYSYENLTANADRLSKLYPDIISVSEIGRSVEGRELTLIKLGKGGRKIFVIGAHHAREYISSAYLMYSIDNYAYSYAAGVSFGGFDIRALLDKFTFCIVPMMNPDGVNLVQNGAGAKNSAYVSGLPINEGARYGYKAWKANINGVDLNRNYDYAWDNYTAKYPRGSMGFKGPAAASEPETRAVQQYLLSEAFEGFLSFHSQGNVYYFYDDKVKPFRFDKILDAQTKLKPVSDSGDDGVTGGSFSHFVQGNFDGAEVTIELCDYVGPYPYPDSGFDKVWGACKNVLLLFADALK